MSKSKKMVRSLNFLIASTRLALTKLKQTFVKTLIFCHFDLKCYIWIKTNILGYAIGEIFNQLILDNLG